jgi:hypothetical protein
MEPYLQAFPDFFKKIIELLDITLLAENQKNELVALRFLEKLDCALKMGRELVMFDVDTSGEAFLLKDKILRVEDIFIKIFYYPAEIGKQLDRVLLVLEIYLRDVVYELFECFRLKSLISELLLMSLDYILSLIVFINFWPLNVERITL